MARATTSILDDVRTFFRRFVLVTDDQAVVIALWVLHTFVYNTARATPYLHFWSPEPGSGKSTALEVLEMLTRNGIVADDLTGAALFRLVDTQRPTLLFDEIDGVFAKKNSDGAEDIRKILNSGYRADKKVYRCVGPKNELQAFQVYCPKAIAGLNEIPGTLAHRAIPIAMKPPRHDEEIEDFDPELIEAEALTLQGELTEWAEHAEAQLRDRERRPEKLPTLDARRNEIYRILFRIADLAGGDWPVAAREAAERLSAGEAREDELSLGVQLLGDIRTIMGDDDRIALADLVSRLNELEDSPWGGFKDGAGINSRGVGWKLKPFQIKAKTVRINDVPTRGYEKTQFTDSWARYLAPPASKPTQRTQAPVQAKNHGSQKRHEHDSVSLLRNGASPHEQTDVPLVSLLNPNELEGLLAEAASSERG